jgi:hypothetical protein
MIMTTSHITPDTTVDDPMDAGEPTTYLLRLTDAGTPGAQWVLGTEEDRIGFYAEFGRPAPSTPAGAEPGQDVADWVAASLGVTGVALKTAGAGWSVTLVA